MPGSIKFRARENVAVISSSSNEHLAVWQERRGMGDARGGHFARRSPQAGRRVVEFRARENCQPLPFSSSSDKYLAVCQQRRGVTVSCSGHLARRGPEPGRGIIQFRARENAAVVLSSSDEHLAVWQE